MLFSLVAKNQDPLGLQRLKAVLDTHVVLEATFPLKHMYLKVGYFPPPNRH